MFFGRARILFLDANKRVSDVALWMGLGSFLMLFAVMSRSTSFFSFATDAGNVDRLLLRMSMDSRFSRADIDFGSRLSRLFSALNLTVRALSSSLL